MHMRVYLTIRTLIIDNDDVGCGTVHRLQGVFQILVHNSSSKFPFPYMTSK